MKTVVSILVFYAILLCVTRCAKADDQVPVEGIEAIALVCDTPEEVVYMVKHSHSKQEFNDAAAVLNKKSAPSQACAFGPVVFIKGDKKALDTSDGERAVEVWPITVIAYFSAKKGDYVTLTPPAKQFTAFVGKEMI